MQIKKKITLINFTEFDFQIKFNDLDIDGVSETH